MLAEQADRQEVAQAIRIQPLEDADLITQTLRHPRIFPHIRDDLTPSAEDVEVVLSPAVTYLGAYARGLYLGLFFLHRHNCVLFEVHTALLPHAWGARAVECAKACIEWVFANTACERLITSVPEDNPLALRLALKAGMRHYGINPQSMRREGVLLDLVMLGISKEQPCQPQQQ